MSDEVLPLLFGKQVRRIHCVGVGGMGVAPLAIYLAKVGFVVSGEDDALTREVERLLLESSVRVGAMDDACELVVYSSAIAKTHPVYRRAAERGLPLVRRGEMLAEVVREKKLVAVCGSHGKTTTTAMLIAALRSAGFHSGYVLGGLLADGSSIADAGADEWVVAEIDESDGTIERFSPEITVAVNLDWDHPDHYRRREDLERTFAELFRRTRGTVLVNEACTMTQQIKATFSDAGGESSRFLVFGKAGDFQGERVHEGRGMMTLQLGGAFSLREAKVRSAGEFNASNAVAALAAAQCMGAVIAADVLARFPGVRRRQTVLYSEGGVTVLEDYAHHPAEIRALLGSLRKTLDVSAEAARGGAGAGHLIVVFQPHRFSRTKQFKAEFAEALRAADRVVLLEVYGAGETPIAGGLTADVCAELMRQDPASAADHVANDGELIRLLTNEVRAGDLVAFVGAGDIDRKARAWIEAFRATR